MSTICKHISTQRKEVNGKTVQILSLSQTLADYLNILNEIQLSDKMPKDVKNLWIRNEKQKLLNGLERDSKDKCIEYHIIPFDMDLDEKDKMLEELTSSPK
jgi:hypothetical protein